MFGYHISILERPHANQFISFSWPKVVETILAEDRNSLLSCSFYAVLNSTAKNLKLMGIRWGDSFSVLLLRQGYQLRKKRNWNQKLLRVYPSERQFTAVVLCKTGRKHGDVYLFTLKCWLAVHTKICIKIWNYNRSCKNLADAFFTWILKMRDLLKLKGLIHVYEKIRGYFLRKKSTDLPL